MADVFAVTLDGRKFPIQDLPAGTIDKIAKEHTVHWSSVVDQPLYDLAVAQDVVRAVAELHGLSAPEFTPRNILTFFELVADDVPEIAEVSDGPLSSGDEDSTAG